jgi:UDP-N-acetyl-D-mannosaminuronic acid dehydrogenase
MLDKTNYLNGLGYIGLTIASLLGTKGFQVHGVDVSEHVVNIKKGKKQDP